MSKTNTRLIKKTEIYVPVGNRMYRHTETLEEIIKLPISAYIDLTKETADEVVDLTKENSSPTLINATRKSVISRSGQDVDDST